ncbi:GGDEF domain-containing protein [Orrella sp. 11846]|uniref:GGDEF domain-containing protein n=1 Tax=Orrella sp. 11846 TaxID=3409913 RepID=UPI003B5B6A4B
MLILDTQTLIIVVSFIYFLVGAMTFFAAVNSQHGEVLRLAAFSAILGGCAFLLGLKTTNGRYWGELAVWFSNPMLIVSTALLLSSVRVYTGKRPRWNWVLIAPIVWIGLCFWEPFISDVNLRVILFSAIIAIYSFAMINTLLKYQIKDIWKMAPMYFVLSVHGLFYLLRILLQDTTYNFSTPLSLSVTAMEEAFFIVVFNYSLLLMVHKRTEKAFQQAALQDELTRIPNRRAFFEDAKKLLQSSNHAGNPVAALMCDLDHFKLINDEFGHEHGNQVLILFANTLKAAVPNHGIYARIGGEEFALLIEQTSASFPLEVAQSICQRFHALSHTNLGKLSVSIGVAFSTDVGYDIDSLLSKADDALYHAKRNGRNHVQTWPLPDR